MCHASRIKVGIACRALDIPRAIRLESRIVSLDLSLVRFVSLALSLASRHVRKQHQAAK